MSKAIPFLTRPEKLDGSMPGDMGFDPMGLSEIQGKVLSGNMPMLASFLVYLISHHSADYYEQTKLFLCTS